MYKLFTILMLWCSAIALRAQETSLNLDFADPAHADRFNFIVDTGGEVQKSVANGEMKLVLNKKEWHFFQVWVNAFDFINNPYISFRIKTDQATPVRIWVKQADGAELTIFDESVASGTDFTTINFAVENIAPLTTDIQEIGIDMGGYQVPPTTFAGTVYLDDFKLGEAAAPDNSLDLDFSDPAHADRLNFIGDTGGEVVKTVTAGELQLALNKKEWHFFQIWVNPLDLIRNPYFSLLIKADQVTPLRVWVVEQGGVTKDLFNGSIQPGSDYQNIQITLDDVIPLTTYIQELNLDIGGYQVPPAVFSGTVYIDEIKLGASAKPATEVYGTSYTEDFSSDLYAGWAGGEGFAISRENDALRFDINRETPVTDGELSRLASLNFEGKVLNLEANPVINIDVKASEPFEFSIIAEDNFNQRKEHKVRVIAANDYQRVAVNLGSVPGIDLAMIQKLYFGFNRAGFAFQATAWFDNIFIGDTATNLPVMDAITDKSYYKNTGQQKIALTHISNASAVTVGNGNALIENVTVTPISNGTAALHFALKANATGEETVVLNVIGVEGYGVNTYSFQLKVEGNFPPTIDSLQNIQAEKNKTIKIDLTGISDGNITTDQTLSFVVTSSDKKVMTGKVSYSGEGPYATLWLYPKKKGTATITVKVKDNGDGSNQHNEVFTAKVFNSLNDPPSIDVVDDLEIYEDAGPSSITLTGIDDGDRQRQGLVITATNSNPAVIKDVSVSYTSGSSAVLFYTPVADTTGNSTITIKVKDKGGNGSNDGNDSTMMSFNITVLKRPVTGYVATLDRSVEGFNGNDKYVITEVDSGSFKALVFQCTDKFYWDGVSMDLPQELDLSEHPYLTMEVFPVGQNTLHWIWFYDVTGMRNELNNLNKVQEAVAGQWNKIVFDFSGENDWINSTTNADINRRRIARVLFDMHNDNFSWPPPPNYTGTFIVRNIRIGSSADFQVTPVATIGAVSDQVAFTNRINQTINLAGISNGNGGNTGVTLSITNSNPSVVMNPVLSAVDTKGRATLKFATGPFRGKSTVTVTASAGAATPVTISFNIQTLPDSASAASVVTLNLNKRYQRMHGFGTFSVASANAALYTDEMGATAMRVGIISNQFEPVNDNDDPFVLNMEGFDYSAFDWGTLRDLKAKGVENFILTSWSPPAWMKTNLSVDYFQAGYTKNTDGTTNRLDYAMYEEFAESMVAVVKAFEQRAGIRLLAIGLQNEPAFHEPYPSAILGPDRFVEMIKVAGRRFAAEGIETRLYMPEQVSMFVDDNNQYLNALKADPEADQYCDIFAIHGYGSDGITPGQPNFSEWQHYRDNAASGNNPKEVWMTETHKDYASWQDALQIAGAIYGALEHGNVSLWTQWAFEGPFVQQGKPTGMLYAMSNFAKFIKPGDVRIESLSPHEDILATTFINEWSGKTSVVMINKGELPVSVKVQGAGVSPLWLMYNTAENRNLEKMNTSHKGVFLLPAKSVTTLLGLSFVWGYNASAVVEDSVVDNAAEKNKRSLAVYPNPSNGMFYLGGDADLLKAEIVDFTGHLRYSAALKPDERAISVAGLPKGIYFIKVYAKSGLRTERVVIE